MANNTILEKITDGTVVLKQNEDSNQVQELKKILYQLGFDGVKSSNQEIDGIYDKGTVSSVKSFCEKNSVNSDGTKVDKEIAQMMQKRLTLLQPLLELQLHLQNDDLDKIYFKGSPHKDAIKGLQLLLKEALGANSNFASNSGEFDSATVNALQQLSTGSSSIPNNSSGIDDTNKKNPPPIQSHHNCQNVLADFNKDGLDKILKKGGIDPRIKEVKKVLFDLGFEKQLGHNVLSKLDNVYDDGLAKAVAAFCGKNNLISTGEKITSEIAKALNHRLSILGYMEQLFRNKDIKETNGAEKPKIRPELVNAIQNVLVDLLDLNKIPGKDNLHYGKLDKAMIEVIKSYFSKFHGGKKITLSNVINLLLKDISPHYGQDWEKHVVPFQPPPKIPNSSQILINYKNPVLLPEKTPVIVHKEFVPYMERICKYAVQSNVKLLITSSYRPKPISYNDGQIAMHSNHMIGFAIDMNVKYGPKHQKLACRKYMNKGALNGWDKGALNGLDVLDPSVADFLSKIIKDEKLRWGGLFGRKKGREAYIKEMDTVHIDIPKNYKLLAQSTEKYIEFHEATLKVYNEMINNSLVQN